MNKIKKIVACTALAGLLVVFALPALAQGSIPQSCKIKHDLSGLTGITCPAVGAVCNFNDAAYSCGMCCLMNTIYNVTNWIFLILIAVAVFYVILGAFNFVTAGGNTEQTGAARNYIMYAAIGILVALLAKAVPAIVKLAVGI